MKKSTRYYSPIDNQRVRSKPIVRCANYQTGGMKPSDAYGKKPKDQSK